MPYIFQDVIDESNIALMVFLIQFVYVIYMEMCWA